jgi:ATP-dependent Lhr-like helicase
MALIGQHGGITVPQAWDILIRGGTFTGVDLALFKRLLRRMGDPEIGLLEQAKDGTLLPGPTGERLLESRDIFSVFMTPEDYKVIADGGRVIGQVPGTNPLSPGQMLILAGRRWRIVDVDAQRRELSVRPAMGGSPPIFGGEPQPPADGVIEEMRRVWEDLSIPAYLDSAAKQLLVEARETYDRMGLRHSEVARHDGQILLFPWVGQRKQQALILALSRADLAPAPLGVAIGVGSEHEGSLVSTLGSLVVGPPQDAVELAKLVENKIVEKFDAFLGDDLLQLAWARDRLDVASLATLASKLLASLRYG